MDERSSIFSSKAARAGTKPCEVPLTRRLPWAFLGAVGLIALVELSLHFTKWPNPIPYALGRDEYYAVAATIDRAGSSNIAIVGSSRSREGMSMPLLRSTLKAQLGREVSVTNYSTGGGRAIDFEAIVNRLMRAKPLPRTIIVGLAERDFAGTGWQYDNAPIFWNLHDWRSNYERRGWEVMDDLPTVLRTTAGQHIRLIGRREQIALRLSEMIRARSSRATPSPVRGEPTPWHVAAPHKKIDRKDPEMRAKVQKYVARDLLPAAYPNPDQVSAFERMAETCQKRGVRLIVYEIPISGQLMREMPAGMNDTYRSIVVRTTEKYGAQFVRLRDLGFRGSFRDFREPSHMNLDSAQRLTQAMADRVLVPALKRDAEREKRDAQKKRHKVTAHAAHSASTHPTTRPAASSHPATRHATGRP